MRRLARANVDALPVRDHRLCVAATGPGAAHRPIFCLSGGEDITKAELRSPRIRGSRRGEMEALDLKGVMLVGHSSGAGETTRYVGRHGTSRISKMVIISSIPPLM